MASVKAAAVRLCMHSAVSNNTSFTCFICISVTRKRLITATLL